MKLFCTTGAGANCYLCFRQHLRRPANWIPDGTSASACLNGHISYHLWARSGYNCHTLWQVRYSQANSLPSIRLSSLALSIFKLLGIQKDHGGGSDLKHCWFPPAVLFAVVLTASTRPLLQTSAAGRSRFPKQYEFRTRAWLALRESGVFYL